MGQSIEAIFIDLGNTLRILIKDQAHMAQARRKIVELVGTDESPETFCEKLDTRYKTYRKWAFENLTEAPEPELWTRWLTPEFPADKIAPLGVELTYQYRQSMGRRVVVERGKEVVIELYKRGYILGLISNVITSREIPDWMDADGFTPYFKSVVLSSVFGKRKPDPSIYLEAARLAGVEPSQCVYVGDNLKRDVTGARQAGFGMVVIMISPEELAEATITDENRPDSVIHEFSELLDIFPAREHIHGR
ncbi:MAG: HAD-superfamily hydrolase subfamily variant 1 [Chloroflexi bacterium]|nr:HAD-superfamily hydrolase subfamily variant 1 [Chloroflexota bacterium]